jgi:hypothetical protein
VLSAEVRRQERGLAEIRDARLPPARPESPGATGRPAA